MVVALEQFIKQIEDSGVIAAGKLENFIPPKATPKDAQELARQLVQSKQLTKFQAQEIYQGRAKSLILGNYTILDKIGAGGMGQVFKAEHRRMKRVVAIKMLPKAVTQDAMAVARFQREVEAAAKLRHSNIVATDDADEAAGVHILVMEYVEGADLSALVKKDGPLSVGKALNCILQAARGLKFAHGEGVVHRDIKPANLLLDRKGTVKILDMGLARISVGGDAATQAELTGTGAVMGTVDYMAPEQALSTRHADARADIYSLGCTLHYLLTGKPMYEGETLMAKLLAHREQPIPSLGPAVPDELQAIFEHMVAKDAADRYPEIGPLVADLEVCSASLSDSGGMPGSQPTSTSANRGGLTFLNRNAKSIARKKSIAGQKPVSGKTGKSRQKLMVAGAVLLGLGVAGAAGLLHRARTAPGTLRIEIDQPDALVQVIGEDGKIEIEQTATQQTLNLSLPPGRHRFKIEKDGYEPFEEVVELQPGDGRSVEVRLPRLFTSDTLYDPEFKRWLAEAARLPAQEQIAAVNQKLHELNPKLKSDLTGPNGGGTPVVADGMVTELRLSVDEVDNIAPLRAMSHLRSVTLLGAFPGAGRLADLSPLRGMPLTDLLIGSGGLIDLSPLRGMPLINLHLLICNVYDLAPLAGMQLQRFHCHAQAVSDLSPLRGMPLREFRCVDLQALRDLSPLEGMPLTAVQIDGSAVSDLSPLAGAPLTDFLCISTLVRDLTPLKGMPIRRLHCSRTPVDDLSPLAEMPLDELGCSNTQVADLTPLAETNVDNLQCFNTRVSDLLVLKGCRNLHTLGLKNLRAPAADAAALKAALPICRVDWNGAVIPVSTFRDSAFKQWMKQVAGLEAEAQVAAVVKKLQELNPDFDGKELHSIEAGGVKSLSLTATRIADLSPVRALTKLVVLDCYSDGWADLADLSPLTGLQLIVLKCGGASVADLSPLKGMPLTHLSLGNTQVADITPLAGMKLLYLDIHGTAVASLSSLKGMPLKELDCSKTRIADLTPLTGMKLKSLNCSQTLVSDLTPLKDVQLTDLRINATPVADLSSLTGMRLGTLVCNHTRVNDLSPLAGMPLATLECAGVSNLEPVANLKLTQLRIWPGRVTKGLEAIRKIGNLQQIAVPFGYWFPAADFWKKYDAGEFAK